MSSINQQPLAASLALADQFLLWSNGNGDTRRASLTDLLALFTANGVAPSIPASVSATFPIFLPFIGGVNAITAAAGAGIVVGAYALGNSFRFIPVSNNTAATTINIATLGVKNLFMDGAACVGGELTAGVPVDIVYDGAQFQIVGDGAAITYGSALPINGRAAFNKVAITQPAAAATLTIANLKTLTASNTLTLAGADGKGITLTNSLTVSGNDGTLSFGAAGKTLTANNSIALSGTDATVMTFPGVSASIPGLAVANTFSVPQTVSIVAASSFGLTTTSSGNSSSPLLVQNTGTANGGGMQVSYTPDPNDTTHEPYTFYANVGVTQRYALRSNGGIANFSANNVNLSDMNAKEIFEDYTPELLDDLESRFLAIRRGRFKYNDQTHADWNYGKSAQSVQAAIPELAGVWNETKQTFRTEQRQVMRSVDAIDPVTLEVIREQKAHTEEHQVREIQPTPEDEKLICVYDHDIGQIGEALLARLLVRVRILEESYAKR